MIKHHTKQSSLALSKGLVESLLPVALGLLASLDSHVQCSEMVLKFKVDGTFGCGERDLLPLRVPRDFVNLGNILSHESVKECLPDSMTVGVPL